MLENNEERLRRALQTESGHFCPVALRGFFTVLPNSASSHGKTIQHSTTQLNKATWRGGNGVSKSHHQTIYSNTPQLHRSEPLLSQTKQLAAKVSRIAFSDSFGERFELGEKGARRTGILSCQRHARYFRVIGRFKLFGGIMDRLV